MRGDDFGTSQIIATVVNELFAAADQFCCEKRNRKFVMSCYGVAVPALFGRPAHNVRHRPVRLNEVKISSGDVCERVTKIANERYTFQEHFR